MNNIDKNGIIQKVENTIVRIRNFLNSFISDNLEESKKAYKLSKWLDVWMDYLNFEKIFKPQKLKRYNRGEIIYVNFGFNISNELGGAHYAIVINNNDSINNPMLVVIPLTSIKPNTNMNKLGQDRMSIGNELFDILKEKLKAQMENLGNELSRLTVDVMQDINEKQKSLDIKNKLEDLSEKFNKLEKQKKRIDKMQKGSIVHLGQIRAISKMRVIMPKNNSDFFAKVVLGPKTMDAITERMLSILCKKNIKSLDKNISLL